MKLTAICIGKTKRHKIRGHDVTTAYLKSEVRGSVKVHASGIEGNEVAVHNDHIYAVSTTTYDYWKDRLGGNDEDWPKGRFAENLIIDGLDEVAPSRPRSAYMHETLAVGDSLRVSSPLGQFTLARGNPKPVVLFAGGIGLTPLLAMLKAHTSVKNYPPVFFFHAVQDGLHHALLFKTRF
ncbi:MOSC domain-containing protein [Endozoicomonas sp. ALD040]|uniref:MOSC domain-containing protein n=1 Tax=unclassified Endozoicomonas TaxID=2644528 RepID=UPI003BB15051